MQNNPIKQVRLAAMALADEVNKAHPDRVCLEVLLTELLIEAEKFGLKIRETHQDP